MSWGQLSGILAKNSLEKRIPIIGEFELTARCNLGCKMCYVRHDTTDREAIAKERSEKEWIRLAYEAREEGMLFLLLTGGEVFLRKDFKTIYEEICMMGFNVTIYTNGTLITPQVASWIGNIAPSQIDVTVYGASPETYGKVCGDSSGFEKAIRGINLLRAQGINVQIKTTVVKGNVDDFDKLSDMTHKLGLSLGIVNYISPRREGNSNCPEAERLSPKELAEFEKKVSIKFLNEKLNYQSSKELTNDINLENIKSNVTDLYCGNNFPCSNGKNAFWITWDGRMVPCSLMNKPETYPLDKGFSAAWREIQKLCYDIPMCKSCNQCNLQDYCESCPAKLKNETGKFDEAALYLCELARERKNLIVV
jgi:MoaA/NifB/PqqE/SkfB family radical SAM enzyme